MEIQQPVPAPISTGGTSGTRGIVGVSWVSTNQNNAIFKQNSSMGKFVTGVSTCVYFFFEAGVPVFMWGGGHFRILSLTVCNE